MAVLSVFGPISQISLRACRRYEQSGQSISHVYFAVFGNEMASEARSVPPTPGK
jgi:hypothetical protein